MAARQATEQTFKKEIESGLTLVDFYTDGCGPCKMLAPILDELATEVTDAKIVKVNAQQEAKLAREYKVMAVPTLILLKDGKEIEKTMGFQSKEALLSLIEKNQA